METARKAVPITDADLDALKARAEQQITRINNTDLELIIKKLAPEETYRTLPIELDLVLSIRDATCLYLWMADWLLQRTGQREEAAQSVVPTDSIKKKQAFSSAYAIWVMANFIVMDCEDLLKGKDQNALASVNPNFKFDSSRTFTSVLQIVFSYYADTLQSDDGKGNAIIKNATDIVAITRDFWKVVSTKALEICKQAEPAIQGYVADTTFHHNEFVVAGFVIDYQELKKSSATWVKVQPEEIVGNDEAIISLRRLCDRIALFDSLEKKNPFLEIGGLYQSALLDGPPGTGKTTLARMAMTWLAKRAEQVGMAYLFKSLEASQIKSEWYGRTSRLLDELIKSVIDPANLAILVMDDIDLLIGQRDDPGSGGADKDILKGLMDFLSGVGTDFRGNYFTLACTNKPTAADDALRQRFVFRTIVKGPESWEDYADLVALMLKKPAKFDMVKIADNGYSPLHRAKATKLSHLAQSNVKGATWRDVGQFISDLRKADPWFTGRSVKNAMDVVITKAGDFDVPEEWFEKPEVFRTKTWDERMNMVKDLFGKIDATLVMTAIEEQFSSEQRYQEQQLLRNKK